MLSGRKHWEWQAGRSISRQTGGALRRRAFHCKIPDLHVGLAGSVLTTAYSPSSIGFIGQSL